MADQSGHYQPTPPIVPETTSQGASGREIRTGLAITALICGIAGFCFPPLGLLGIVAGIVALVKASKRPQEYGGKGLAIGGICTGGATFVIGTLIWAMVIAVMLPSFARARELSRRVVCSANLSGIGKALYTYANNNQDLFPPDLNVLVKSGAITPQMLQCPSTESPGYIYITGLTTDDNPDTPIVYEALENHGGEGGNILFVDSHVEFYNQQGYEKIIAPYKNRAIKVEIDDLEKESGAP